MFPYKSGFDFIVVRFGGYKMHETESAARSDASLLAPDTGVVYQRGFFSEKLGKRIATGEKGQWFPLDRD